MSEVRAHYPGVVTDDLYRVLNRCQCPWLHDSSYSITLCTIVRSIFVIAPWNIKADKA